MERAEHLSPISHTVSEDVKHHVYLRAESGAHKPCSTNCFPDPWTWEPKFLPEGWGVVGDDDKLGFALTQRLQGLLVAQEVLARLHHQSQPGIDVLRRLFLQVIYAQKSECNGPKSSSSTLLPQL